MLGVLRIFKINSGIRVQFHARQLSYGILARQILFPLTNDTKDVLRSIPNIKKDGFRPNLEVSFQTKQTHMKQPFEKGKIDDDSNILPEQIREDASSLKNFTIKTGRTVDVNNFDTNTACRRLNTIVFSNQIAIERRKQKFYMKPGKRAELKRSQRHRKDFMKGFKRLMEIVKDAKRKGF